MKRRTLATTAALALAAVAAPANAWRVSIHVEGSRWGCWIIIDTGHTNANYDAITHTGVIPYTIDGPFAPMTFTMTDVPGVDGLPVTLTEADMNNIMGEFEVLGGLGTGVCEFSLPNIWVTGSNWGVHLIFNPGNQVFAAMPLTGFDDDGGQYEASGLAIPVDFEVHRPDGSTVVVPDVIHTIRFSSPLDLSDPCPADCDGNGTLNIDDIDCFISSFLSGCA